MEKKTPQKITFYRAYEASQDEQQNVTLPTPNHSMLLKVFASLTVH